VKRAFAAFVVSTIFFVPHTSYCFPSVAIEEVRVEWHLAGLSEAHADWAGARVNFNKVIEDAAYLTLSIREWYRGLAWLGVSRASARLGDTAESRRALTLAFSHGFSNAALLREDSFFTSVAGKKFVDSLGQFWETVQEANRGEWLMQEPVVFLPHDLKPAGPLIIALHGGNDNYRNFAMYWSGIADRIHAIVVVPPGQIRNSETENSWEYDMSTIEAGLLSLAREYTTKYQVDPREIYLAGFSQGAQAAIALTLMHPDIFHGAIGFSGFWYVPISDSQIAKAAAEHTRIYALSGEYDSQDFLNHLSAARERIVAHGIPFRFEVEKDMIHEVPLDFDRRFEDAWHWIRDTKPAGQSAKQ
jgi:predicted esterase